MGSENGESRAGFLLTALAALGGTMVGNAIHKLIIVGLPSDEEDEEEELVINGVLTHTLLVGFLAKGRPGKAFILGAAVTLPIGDTLDRALFRLFS